MPARKRTAHVALLVSAWIEMKERYDEMVARLVALLVSAWIEINLKGDCGKTPTVALLVSAWIEISDVPSVNYPEASHSS